MTADEVSFYFDVQIIASQFSYIPQPNNPGPVPSVALITVCLRVRVELSLAFWHVSPASPDYFINQSGRSQFIYGFSRCISTFLWTQLDRPTTNQSNETCDVTCASLGKFLLSFEAGKRWRPGQKHTEMCFKNLYSDLISIASVDLL